MFANIARPFLVLLLIATTVIYADEYHRISSKIPKTQTNEDKDFWYAQGQEELRLVLDRSRITNVAKNVIVFIGDGMSLTTVTASRIHNGQLQGQRGEEGLLSFEQFPYFGLAKTYSTDFQVTDSSAGATAILCGAKTGNGVLGFDGTVLPLGCKNANANTILESIAEKSVKAGKRAGVISTKEVTDATPAASYAHAPARYWECDTNIHRPNMDEDCPGFKDIAIQLIENEPGRSLNVILGGGYECFGGKRNDGRYLAREWLEEKENAGYDAAFVRTRTEFFDLDLQAIDYLFGLFSNGSLPYDTEKLESNIPTLREMTQAAIDILSRGSEGFFLLVESAKIDSGHHGSKARRALEETIALHEAVEIAKNMTNEQETLIIVTADHSHTLTFSGYPVRGNPILGTTGDIADDSMLYTTLSYANGPGYNYTVMEGGHVERKDPSDFDTTSYDYEQQGAVKKDSESHGGDDCPIYASGPYAHFFHTVHEQNYIAHVMAYASCVGTYQTEDHCREEAEEDKSSSFSENTFLILTSALLLTIGIKVIL